MLTAKDIVLDLKYYFSGLWRKKYIIITAAVLIAVGWSIRLIKAKPNFLAEKTFLISDDVGGGSVGISSILGQFGFGGKCFPKDTQYLLDLLDNSILKNIIERNNELRIKQK